MIADRIEKLAPSGIRAFFDLVLGMPDVISLGVGEPDFITPWKIREKAITALEEGFTSYTSNQGLFVLRQDIARYLKKKYSLYYTPKEEILITVGVSEGFDLALRAILEPGDSVIIVSPHYVSYPALVEVAYGKVLYLVTKEEDGFKINPKKLCELVKKNPKAIVLNYPSNPTGVTYSREELKEIWKILSSKEILVISDEIYGELTYDADHVPVASLDKKAKRQTILLSGFSKGYAMTGFRVGFACAHKKIISAMTKIHAYSMLCGPIISQLAATEALKAQREVIQMRQEYKRRRDFIVKELNALGLSVTQPQGAFYCFPSLGKFKLNSLEFAKKLLFEEKVAVVPGRAFGKEFDSYLRISYANTLDNLKKAIIRIERFLKKLP
ncbi:MAG: aminotransferase class I/II-fold pyridoxal phosphate-dependent enzyme [Candidatus Omnitrophota bacterium]|nr:MAG: aminotransferase class I/II-fold pyridoxal phosphate-dependent enzyme [Candidatus Omnitrophota bacterium]